MTPTPFGEGKTVTSVGLSMALNRLGHRSAVVLRQPSLGPVFGIKGGGAGGGRSTVEPMQEINLRFTGDIDAVATAHNLLAAMLDNHLFHGNELDIDPRRIVWQRTVDMDDRALRQIIIGLGGTHDGVPREDSFLITAASEIMAVVGMAVSYSDLKKRLGQMIVGYSRHGIPVSAAELNASGAMAAVLRDALQPNLVQTTEGTPALVHGGAFANVAQGTASIVSILLALQFAEFAIVEAGFGSDLGAEKFVDIVARAGGFSVDAAVVVVSVRALKHHGGDGVASSESEALTKGFENLDKHLENMRLLGLPAIVAVNRFPTDSADEIARVRDYCTRQNVPCEVSTVFEEGGRGAETLAERVTESCRTPHLNKPVYEIQASIQDKLNAIVTGVYGGDGVDYTSSARDDLRLISKLGLEARTVCVAKTPLSLSDDQTRLGRPRSFRPLVRHLSPASGAEFTVAYMGDIVTMPGLPKHPAAEKIDLNSEGIIEGLQ